MQLNNHILWLICGGAALALHAGAAALFYGSDNVEQLPAGQKGVLLELSFEGAVSGGASQKGNTEETVQVKPVPTPSAPPKENKPQPVVKTPVKPTPTPKSVEDISAPKKNLVPAAKPPVANDRPINPEAQKIADTSDTIQTDFIEESAEYVPAVTNAVGGAGGENAQAAGNQGDGNAAQSGGVGGVIATYEDLVQVWVHKHLLYPKSARKRRLTGIVTVKFVLNDKGQLMTAELLEESSYKILNKAALKTIKRAVPFPVFPVELADETRTFIIPIEFNAT